jgi:pre-rRNA-processing protein TSR1
MSKLARKNQAKQLRANHKDRQEQESRIFHGVDGAPKHVAVVPLSTSIDVNAAIKSLNDGVDVEGEVSDNGTIRVKVDRFRRNLLYLPAKFDLMAVLDICKLADWVIFVLEPEQEYDDQTYNLLLAVESQGITSFTAVVQGFDNAVPAPKRSRHLTELKMGLGRYLPSLDRISSLDSKSDCANLVRTLCTASTKGIRWRDDRSWMLVEKTTWSEQSANPVLHGIVRGRALNPDRLVHVPGWGDCKIKTVRQIPNQSRKRRADEMVVEESGLEWGPTDDQDDLQELAPEVADMTDVASTAATTDQKGVLLDDHHYFSDDDSHIPPVPKRLPAGTSSYQAAWYLDDVSDSESEIEEDVDGDLNMDANDTLRPEDGSFNLQRHDAATEVGPSEYPESEMHVDADNEDEAQQLADFRSSRKKEAEEDMEFPDEIELHPETLARERLAKYRGLKSLRTSEWNTAEDAPFEPSDYRRLLKVADYKKSNNTARKEALTAPIPAGTKVKIELLDVPEPLRQVVPSSLFSLLRHEHKHSVINLNLTLRAEAEGPVKSKEELVVQIGHRKLIIQPVFSASGQTPNDVHKFDRFLHPGRTAIATFTGPLTWGSVPVLVFKRQGSSGEDGMTDEASKLRLIGTATTTPPSHSRVIAKRLILTGHPYKIHKKLVTVRYMFFNREDVAWFAALPLWTKRGRQGFVKEALGTHGYFKATFDGKINPMDAIGVSLYKRVWPRAARHYQL